MIPIKIYIDDVEVKSIGTNDLNSVLMCVGQSSESHRAMGRSTVFTYDDILQRYLEVLASPLEFFCGIFYKDDFVGVIKGRLENKIEPELLILSYILCEKYRGMGLGKNVLREVERYFETNYAIKKLSAVVMQDNTEAINFWEKRGYGIARIFGLADQDYRNMMVLEKTECKGS